MDTNARETQGRRTAGRSWREAFKQLRRLIEPFSHAPSALGAFVTPFLGLRPAVAGL